MNLSARRLLAGRGLTAVLAGFALIICATAFSDARAQTSGGLDPGATFKDCPACPEMVVIPAGKFKMGSNRGRNNEKPVREVIIAKPFAMSTTEVTFDQWGSAPGSLDTSLSHAAGLIEITACHA